MSASWLCSQSTAATQAGQIIDQVAHPSVRDELGQAARELGFRLP
jgi:hypothetical protein